MQAGGAGVEPDLGAAQREVDGGGGCPGYRGEQALDEPGAAGAAHAFDGEGDGGGAEGELGLFVGVVVAIAAASQ